MQPTLRQLTYLKELKNQGSFSAAAETCFVTQSTLSAGIKELENIMGEKLVERSHKHITLTPIGEKVYDHAHIILGHVDGLIEDISQTHEPLSGPLRLGVIPTIAPFLLPHILPLIQTQYPNLELRLFEDLTDRLIDQIHANKIDAALMAFPYETPGLSQNVLFDEAFVFAAHADEVPKKKLLKTDDLNSNNLLLLEDGHCLRDHALSACKLQLPSVKKTFSATSLPTLIQMVGHGYGHTLLPEMALKGTILPDNIRITPFQSPKPTRQIGLCWRNSDQKQENYQLLGSLIKRLKNK